MLYRIQEYIYLNLQATFCESNICYSGLLEYTDRYLCLWLHTFINWWSAGKRHGERGCWRTGDCYHLLYGPHISKLRKFIRLWPPAVFLHA